MIEYKGYEIGQASNYHVWISKDGKPIMHAQCNKKKTDDELREMVDFYIELDVSPLKRALTKDTEEKQEKAVCEYCKGKGLVQIAPNVRGLKKCPYCQNIRREL